MAKKVNYFLGVSGSAVLGEGFCLTKTFRFEVRLDKKLSEQRNVYEIPEQQNEIFCSRLPKAGRSISSARIPVSGLLRCLAPRQNRESALMRQTGFTLVEIVVALAVFAILGTLV